MRLRLLLVAVCALAAAAVAAPPASAAAPSTSASGLTRGGGCQLIPPLDAGQPLGTVPCKGVRPGALVETPLGLCTFNYLFRGSDGALYIGTAGHCLLEEGEAAFAPGSGPAAKNGDGEVIGEFAYAVRNLEQEADFALIRLNGTGAAQASPQMCFFGGPTYLNGSRPDVTSPTVLNHFGNGILVGNLIVVRQETLPARSAVAAGMPDPNHVYAEGLAVPGDSGSGIQSSDGGAVGVIVSTGLHYGSAGTQGVDAGTLGAIRLGPMLARATGATGVGYELQTAPLL